MSDHRILDSINPNRIYSVRQHRLMPLAVFLFVGNVFPITSYGQFVSWNGGSGQAWSQPNSWTASNSPTHRVPTSSDDVVIDAKGGTSDGWPVISGGYSAVADTVDIYYSSGGNSPATLSINAATLTVGYGVSVGNGTTSSAGDLYVEDATLNSPSLYVDGGGYVDVYPGSYVQDGAGSITLTLAATSAAAEFDMSGMSLTASTITLSTSGAGQAEFDWIAGSISATSFTLQSGGTLTWEGTSTTSTSFGGTVKVGGGNIDVISGDTLTLSGGVQNASSGTGILNKIDSGTLILTAASSYTAGTAISGGVLQVGNGGMAGTIAGSVTDNAALVFDRSDSISYSSTISGSGTLAQGGTGTLTLSGTNTYSGGTTINSGILAITSDNAINSGTGGITFNGGVLQFNNYTTSLTFDDADNLNLGAATGDASTLSTGISGSYGLTYSGPGTLILTGANTYAGDSTVSAGTLEYDITSGSVSVADGATVTIASGAAVVADGTIDPFSDTSGDVVNIVNNSTITSGVGGFTVNAGSKSIGTLTGSGDTVVCNTETSISLELSSFQQNSLTTHGVVMVRPHPSGTLTFNTVNSLTVEGAGATLDIQDNALVVDYLTNSDPLTTIGEYLASGFDSGYWDGPGISSSNPIAGAGVGYSDSASTVNPIGRDGSGNWLGHSLDSTSVAVLYTWDGDLNLDGVVDSTDLAYMGNIPTSGPEEGLIG